MNRTLLGIFGLLLAAPLAAQSARPHRANAEELLRMSAEQAAAGNGNEAARLAEMAVERLHAGSASNNASERKLKIVVETEDAQDFDAGPRMMRTIHKTFQGPEQGPEQGPHAHAFQGPFEHHHAEGMQRSDLQQQLHEIHFELAQLRQELQMLREEMGGPGEHPSQRRGFSQQQDFWGPSDRGPWGPSMDNRFPPQGFRGQMREEGRRNFGADSHAWGGDSEEDFDAYGDFDFDFPPNMEQAEWKVIINGEVFEGDAARQKFEEMGDFNGSSMHMRFFGGQQHSENIAPDAEGGWNRWSWDEGDAESEIEGKCGEQDCPHEHEDL